MERPHRLFNDFGQDLPPVVLFAIRSIGFRIPNHFITLKEDQFKSKVIDSLEKELFEISKGRVTRDEGLKAAAYEIVKDRSMAEFSLSQMDYDRVKEFFENVKEEVLEHRAEQRANWSALATEKVKDNYENVLNGRAVEIIDRNNTDAVAKCIFPHCDAEIIVAKNYYNYGSQRFETHLTTRRNHDVPAPEVLINLV